MTKVFLGVALLAMLMLPAVPGASAGACSSQSGFPRAASGFYVDVRTNGDVWLYQETNDIAGLQRGGVSTLGERDSCVDDSNVPADSAVL